MRQSWGFWKSTKDFLKSGPSSPITQPTAAKFWRQFSKQTHATQTRTHTYRGSGMKFKLERLYCLKHHLGLLSVNFTFCTHGLGFLGKFWSKTCNTVNHHDLPRHTTYLVFNIMIYQTKTCSQKRSHHLHDTNNVLQSHCMKPNL